MTLEETFTAHGPPVVGSVVNWHVTKPHAGAGPIWHKQRVSMPMIFAALATIREPKRFRPRVKEIYPAGKSSVPMLGASAMPRAGLTAWA